MEYLQYTTSGSTSNATTSRVLNLIINGIPSILAKKVVLLQLSKVLNLIINGIPSIHTEWFDLKDLKNKF